MKTSQINEKAHSRCRIGKLLALIPVAASMVFQPLANTGAVITTDPALAAAIVLQTETLEGAYKERKKHREAIETLQTSIALGLDRIHSVEDMILDYMGNASGVLTNMIQIKNIAEYTIEIGNKLAAITKAIPNNPKGAAITAICHNQMATTVADITGMADLVTNLVTTKYSLKDAKSEGDKRNVNLLTAAERYNILMSVEQKMMKIRYDLQLIHYFIQTLGWRDLWFQLDRESYLKAISVGIDVNVMINKWNKITK